MPLVSSEVGPTKLFSVIIGVIRQKLLSKTMAHSKVPDHRNQGLNRRRLKGIDSRVQKGSKNKRHSRSLLNGKVGELNKMVGILK